MKRKHLLCTRCDDVFPEGKLLVALNPFDAGDRITGCPTCLQVESIVAVCQAPRCKARASSGNPMPGGGYELRCYDHRPENEGPEGEGSAKS